MPNLWWNVGGPGIDSELCAHSWLQFPVRRWPGDQRPDGRQMKWDYLSGGPVNRPATLRCGSPSSRYS